MTRFGSCTISAGSLGLVAKIFVGTIIPLDRFAFRLTYILRSGCSLRIRMCLDRFAGAGCKVEEKEIFEWILFSTPPFLQQSILAISTTAWPATEVVTAKPSSNYARTDPGVRCGACSDLKMSQEGQSFWSLVGMGCGCFTGEGETFFGRSSLSP